jgi:methylenetetrahydrofolate dehydrogenase (NADP+)/methenyltetrahydrofolate cyclohydrolase
MSAVILDGRKISQDILRELAPQVDAMRAKARAPGLAVVLVGDNPASQIYVRGKVKASEDLGIRSFQSTPAADIGTEELLSIVEGFNQDPNVDGILVQTPLPKQIDTARIFLAISPDKDADGFHPYNVGNLVTNRPSPRSCTPAGVMELLHRYEIPISGRRAVVVGRSETVGKPMALMLLNESATVSVCHSRTQDLAEECRRADILVVAMGRPAMITSRYIKPGAVVVDIGINRLTDEAEVRRLYGHEAARLAGFAKSGSSLVGDVEPIAMQALASAYTPVPGGVGPLTIAMLMFNTVQLAQRHLQC